MKQMLIVAILLIGWIYPAGAGTDDMEVIQKAFPGCMQTRCVVDENLGGHDEDFEPALEALLRKVLLVPLIINGSCHSWCALAADMLNVNDPRLVCVTPKAVLEFHKGYTLEWVVEEGRIVELTYDFEDPPHSVPVLEWVNGKGGFPIALWDTDMLKMPFEDASKIWRTCTPEEMN